MAAKNLGSYGEQRNHDDVEIFTYFGETFRITDDFSGLAFTDWIEEYGNVDENDPKAVTAVKAYARLCVHADDFDTFWALAKRNRQTAEDIMELGQDLIEAMVGHPIGQPSDSSGGQSSIDTKSAGDSSLRVIKRLERDGRPDLGLIVSEAVEHRKTA